MLTTSRTYELQPFTDEILNSVRDKILYDVAKINEQQLLVYWDAFCKVHPNNLVAKFANTKIPNANDVKEVIDVKILESGDLIDYALLTECDTRAQIIRHKENAPKALDFLAYALSKHEDKSFDGELIIAHSKEVNEKALYTFFYMAVAAGYNMALEEK